VLFFFLLVVLGFELSRSVAILLMEHAWLNGSNEYIMTDDSNFNPTGQLPGTWNQLQAVRPAR